MILVGDSIRRVQDSTRCGSTAKFGGGIGFRAKSRGNVSIQASNEI